MVNWIRSFVFALLIVSGGEAFSQIGFIPMPPPPQQDPCVALQQQVNMATTGLNAWRSILAERRDSLAGGQRRLAEVEGLLALMQQILSEQEGPMTDGQAITFGWITTAIAQSRTYVAQMQAQVLQAEQQVNAWSAMLQNAQAAFNAAGC